MPEATDVAYTGSKRFIMARSSCAGFHDIATKMSYNA